MFESPLCLRVMGLGNKVCAITGDFDFMDFSEGKELCHEGMEDVKHSVIASQRGEEV